MEQRSLAFSFLSSLKGFVVAVLYCFLNGEVRTFQPIRASCACFSRVRSKPSRVFPGAARAPEEVEEMEADSAPTQKAAAASRLHQPQRVPSHTGVPAALLFRQPNSRWTPSGYRGGVIQAGTGSFSHSLCQTDQTKCSNTAARVLK